MEPSLPFSEEAEEALIGAALINPSVIYEIDISPDEFYIDRNRWVWEAILKLSRKNITPDLVTLCDELDKNPNFIELGGAARIASLVNIAPSASGAPHYAAIIHDRAVRRNAIQCANKIVQSAYNPAVDINEAVSKSITDLATSNAEKSSTIHISEVINELYDQVEERSKNPQKIWGYNTGIVDYDRLMGGVHKPEVIYIAGKPGIGKSILAVQMGVNIAKKDQAPGIIFSIEMNAIATTRRIVSAHGEVATRSLKSGDMSVDEWKSFTKACEEMSKLPIYICDQSGLTTQQFRAEVAKLKSRPKGLDWYVLDYLYLMGDTGFKDDNERTKELSYRVRNITRQFDLAGITVNSVTKDVMDGSSPTQKSMKGSGEVIHAADVIFFILNDKDEKNPNIRVCKFEKVRDEDIGLPQFKIIKLRGGFPAFGNLEKREVEMPEYMHK